MYLIKVISRGKELFLVKKDKRHSKPVFTEFMEKAATFSELATAQTLRDDLLDPDYKLSKVNIFRI